MKTPISLFVLFTIMILFATLLLPEVLLAQAPPSLPGKPTQNPVDGGLALLAAAGGGYAIKKLRERKVSPRNGQRLN